MNVDLLTELETHFKSIANIYKNYCLLENADGKAKWAITRLRFLRKKCKSEINPSEIDLLLYCLDTQIVLIEENNHNKIWEFALVASQIILVYQKKLYFHSISLEIKNFQFKWGEQYFPEYKKLYRKSLEKDPRFMTKEEAARFKQKSKSIALIAAPLFMLCGFLYSIFITYIFPAHNDWPMILSIPGMLTLLCGILNMFADKQIAFSKKTEFLLILIGTAMFLTGTFLLYI